MADLIGEDTPLSGFRHPIGDDAAYARFVNPQVFHLQFRLRGRIIFGCGRILEEVRKENREKGGYQHKTSGRAQVCLRLLRDNPHGRAIGLLHCRGILRIYRISPENLDDEALARTMAVVSIIDNLAMRFADEVYKQLPPFFHESHKADMLQTRLGELREVYDDDITRHIDLALDHLEAAWSAAIRDAVRYVGRQLEQDFDGLRAAKLVADLVNHTFKRSKLTERQVRYLCGWG